MWLTTTGLLVTPSWHQATNTGQLMGHKCCPRCPLTSCNSIQNKRQQQQKKSPDTAGHFPRFICHSGPMDWFQRNWSATVAHQTQSCKKKKKAENEVARVRMLRRLCTRRRKRLDTSDSAFWRWSLSLQPYRLNVHLKRSPREVLWKKKWSTVALFLFLRILLFLSLCV